jgi:hypothetical protein
MGLRNAITARSSATFGKTASNLPMFVLRWRPPAQRVSWKRKHIFRTSMLQLPVGDRRESLSRQLSGLQIREGGDAEKEVTENRQDYNANGIIPKPRHLRCVLRGGAPRQHRATASASDMPSGSGKSSHNGTEGLCALTPTRTACRAVHWGSKCKQFV